MGQAQAAHFGEQVLAGQLHGGDGRDLRWGQGGLDLADNGVDLSLGSRIAAGQQR